MESPEWERQHNILLFLDESYEPDSGSNKTIVKLRDKLEEVYAALFVYDYDQIRARGVSIGQAWFDEDSRKDFFRFLSAISADADYGV